MTQTTADLYGAVGAHQLRTYRFLAFVITIVIMAIIGVIAVWRGTDAAVIVSIMTPLATFGGAYTGFGAWHDRSIRSQIVKEEVAHRASQDLPRMGGT